MAFSCGFYNSINHDRLYNAIHMSQLFDGLINDGVYMGFMDYFMVTPFSGMTVQVGAGRAWFNHTWSYNDSPMSITLADPTPGMNRIDAIALVVDNSDEVRMNSIEVISGTGVAGNPSKPTLTDTDSKFYHPLAYITVSAGATEIIAANIENAVGTGRTPFVTGIIETIDIDELIAQWGAEWNQYIIAKEAEFDQWTDNQEDAFTDWVTEQTTEYTTWISTQEAAFTTWSNAQKAAFDAWFETIRDKLDGNVAARLTFQVDALIESITGMYTLDDEVTTVFNQDGSITETTPEGVKTTVFNQDGTITETYPSGRVFVTTFNQDGSITKELQVV